MKEFMEKTQPFQPLADRPNCSSFSMVDVGEKQITRRRALAEGKAILQPRAYQALKTRSNPKGDVLALAEVAGITMAKRTSELIPLCHPLALDQIRIQFELCDSTFSVRVSCEVLTHGKTGVEMEALTGVQGALLTVYDLSKAVDPDICLTQIQLLEKDGGKTGNWRRSDQARNTLQLSEQLRPILEGIPTTVLTISDRASAGKSEDTSGPYLRQSSERVGALFKSHYTVSDEKFEIQRSVLRAIKEDGARLILCTGGTGLGPRDRTPEALLEIADRQVDGFGELLRQEGAKKTPFSYLSRSLAMTIGDTLVIALPGSLRAVQEGWQTLSPLLPHALAILKGEGHGL